MNKSVLLWLYRTSSAEGCQIPSIKNEGLTCAVMLSWWVLRILGLKLSLLALHSVVNSLEFNETETFEIDEFFNKIFYFIQMCNSLVNNYLCIVIIFEEYWFNTSTVCFSTVVVNLVESGSLRHDQTPRYALSLPLP